MPKIKVGPGAKPALGKRGKAWRSYEEACAYMISHLADRLGVTGLEGKQRLRGKISSTRWEIDAKAIDVATGKIVIVEARRHTRARLNQEAVAAVAFRVQDLGAAGAIIVSPHSLQKGARLVADATQVRHVIMAPDSTPDQWVAQLGDVVFVGLHDRVDLNISEELELIVRDASGAIVEHVKI